MSYFTNKIFLVTLLAISQLKYGISVPSTANSFFSVKINFILRSLNASFNVCVFGLKCPISIIMLPLAA